MKVLHLCSYYTLNGLYQNLFDALEERDVTNQVVVFSSNQGFLDKLPKAFITSNSFSNWERLFFYLKHNKAYKDIRTKVDTNADLSHAHSLFSNGYIAMRLKEEFGIPYIVAVRNTDLNVFFKRFRRLRTLGVEILEKAEKIVFLSDSYRKLTFERYVPQEKQNALMKKTVIIPNGIDDHFIENAHPLGKTLSTSPLKLIYVGRINDRNKNVRGILKAADVLYDKGLDLKLKLLGGYDTEFYMIDFGLMKQIKNRPYVELLSKTDKYGVCKELMDSHIFVMPSQFETFGLTYVEAMSQGDPVIYSKGQGFDGQFEEGVVGYHVPWDDTQAIVDAVMKIIEDYERLSKNAAQGAKRYNWHAISDIYDQIYRGALTS